MPVFKPFRIAIANLLIISQVGSSVYAPDSRAGEMVALVMPSPGTMVNLSPAFIPAHLQGVTIDPDNPFKFDFLVHKGDGHLTGPQKREEYTKLVKYFLASLTVPDQDQWVNLSPYEHHRIIADNFGRTEMGRDLLSQDYLLKQITSSLMYPEKGLGRKFWDTVYARAWEKYHTDNIPVNTFNKVWIVPDEAEIYESGHTAYIIKSHLKVMLEEDYLSLNQHRVPTSQSTHTVASRVIREIILPALEKEVNEDKNFALLRQIVSGMVLATWYKRELKESLLGRIYADKAKIKGVDLTHASLSLSSEQIYQRYLTAFKKGVYNYIKEDQDQLTRQRIPRKYFAGGFKMDPAMLTVDHALTSQNIESARQNWSDSDTTIDHAQIIVEKASDRAMFSKRKEINPALIARLDEKIEEIRGRLQTADFRQPVKIASIILELETFLRSNKELIGSKSRDKVQTLNDVLFPNKFFLEMKIDPSDDSNLKFYKIRRIEDHHLPNHHIVQYLYLRQITGFGIKAMATYYDWEFVSDYSVFHMEKIAAYATKLSNIAAGRENINEYRAKNPLNQALLKNLLDAHKALIKKHFSNISLRNIERSIYSYEAAVAYERHIGSQTRRVKTSLGFIRELKLARAAAMYNSRDPVFALIELLLYAENTLSGDTPVLRFSLQMLMGLAQSINPITINEWLESLIVSKDPNAEIRNRALLYYQKLLRPAFHRRAAAYVRGKISSLMDWRRFLGQNLRITAATPGEIEEETVPEEVSIQASPEAFLTPEAQASAPVDTTVALAEVQSNLHQLFEDRGLLNGIIAQAKVAKDHYSEAIELITALVTVEDFDLKPAQLTRLIADTMKGMDQFKSFRSFRAFLNAQMGTSPQLEEGPAIGPIKEVKKFGLYVLDDKSYFDKSRSIKANELGRITRAFGIILGVDQGTRDRSDLNLFTQVGLSQIYRIRVTSKWNIYVRYFKDENKILIIGYDSNNKTHDDRREAFEGFAGKYTTDSIPGWEDLKSGSQFIKEIEVDAAMSDAQNEKLGKMVEDAEKRLVALKGTKLGILKEISTITEKFEQDLKKNFSEDEMDQILAPDSGVFIVMNKALIPKDFLLAPTLIKEGRRILIYSVLRHQSYVEEAGNARVDLYFVLPRTEIGKLSKAREDTRIAWEGNSVDFSLVFVGAIDRIARNYIRVLKEGKPLLVQGNPLSPENTLKVNAMARVYQRILTQLFTSQNGKSIQDEKTVSARLQSGFIPVLLETQRLRHLRGRVRYSHDILQKDSAVGKVYGMTDETGEPLYLLAEVVEAAIRNFKDAGTDQNWAILGGLAQINNVDGILSWLNQFISLGHAVQLKELRSRAAVLYRQIAGREPLPYFFPEVLSIPKFERAKPVVQASGPITLDLGKPVTTVAEPTAEDDVKKGLRLDFLRENIDGQSTRAIDRLIAHAKANTSISEENPQGDPYRQALLDMADHFAIPGLSGYALKQNEDATGSMRMERLINETIKGIPRLETFGSFRTYFEAIPKGPRVRAGRPGESPTVAGEDNAPQDITIEHKKPPEVWVLNRSPYLDMQKGRLDRITRTKINAVYNQISAKMSGGEVEVSGDAGDGIYSNALKTLERKVYFRYFPEKDIILIIASGILPDHHARDRVNENTDFGDYLKRYDSTGAADWDEFNRLNPGRIRHIGPLFSPKAATDTAMNSDVGGIDLNSVNMNLLIKRDANGALLPISQQDLAQLSRIDGFVPVIIAIRPAVHLPILSELLKLKD